jgi:glycosyltransferase involved in cell wall biosynthesis
MTISLNMIVGRWKEPFLKEAVNSVLPIIDDIIFVNSDPEENINLENMLSFGATIVNLPRPRDKDFSYAEARNAAVKATKTDWIIKMDADEALNEKYYDELLYYTTTEYTSVDAHFWHHVLHPDYIEEFPGNIKKILFRTDSLTWTNAVHEEPSVKGIAKNAMHLRKDHYGYCRGAREIFKRHEFYTLLEGGSTKGMDPDHWLDYKLTNGCLIPYPENHPAAIVVKLEEMFPDLGIYTLLKG